MGLGGNKVKDEDFVKAFSLSFSFGGVFGRNKFTNDNKDLGFTDPVFEALGLFWVISDLECRIELLFSVCGFGLVTTSTEVDLMTSGFSTVFSFTFSLELEFCLL